MTRACHCWLVQQWRSRWDSVRLLNSSSRNGSGFMRPFHTKRRNGAALVPAYKSTDSRPIFQRIAPIITPPPSEYKSPEKNRRAGRPCRVAQNAAWIREGPRGRVVDFSILDRGALRRMDLRSVATDWKSVLRAASCERVVFGGSGIVAPEKAKFGKSGQQWDNVLGRNELRRGKFGWGEVWVAGVVLAEVVGRERVARWGWMASGRGEVAWGGIQSRK